MIGKMRLLASEPVVKAAEEVMETIVATYDAPKRSMAELRDRAAMGELNFLVDFGEICRKELRDLEKQQTVISL